MKNLSQKQKRESNFELLRLVSMLSIVLYHFIYHSTWKEILDTSYYRISPRGIVSSFLVPFVYFGVSCFILISGYFRIKFKISNLIKLLLQCIFYSAIIYAIVSILIYKNFTIRDFSYTFLPLSHSPGLWFIPSYICLFLIAPFLNTAIDHISKTNYISILIVYFFINVYLDFYNLDSEITGTLTLFVFLYLTGAFIQKYINYQNIYKLRLISFSSFIIISSILGSAAVFSYDNKAVFFSRVIRYDNPLVIILSIFIFLFFYTLKFRSSLINYLSSSSLAVYLIHENIYLRRYTYELVYKLYECSYPGFLVFVFIILYALIILFSCIFIDKIRMIITNPIEKLIINLNLDDKYNKLLKFISPITDDKKNYP